MGVLVPPLGGDGDHLGVVHDGQVGGEQLARDDDPVVPQPVAVSAAVQGVADPASDVLHVGGALAQVRVLHPGKGRHVVGNHLAHGPVRAETLVDQRRDLADEAAVFHDHQVAVENGGVRLGEDLADPLLHVDGMDARLFQRQQEPALLLGARPGALQDRLLAGTPVHHRHLSQGEAGGDPYAGQCRAHRPLAAGARGVLQHAAFFQPVDLCRVEGALLLLLPDRVEQLRVGDDAGDLPGDGGDGADLLGGEGARLAVLDDDDADRVLSFEEGDAEEGEHLLLLGLAEILVARVPGGVVGRHHAALLDGEAGETFGGLHGDADRQPRQAAGGVQPQSLAVLLQEVDGADVRLHSLSDQVDYVVQGLLQVMGVKDQCADIFKCPKTQFFPGLLWHCRPLWRFIRAV